MITFVYRPKRRIVKLYYRILLFCIELSGPEGCGFHIIKDIPHCISLIQLTSSMLKSNAPLQ
jgi:hypothetical protein